MIAFDPRCLIPRLEPGSYTYVEAQAHAAEVDRFLGFEIEKVEQEIATRYSAKPGQQYWIGLAPQALQTPYVELLEILLRLDVRAGLKIIDIGAGYGRMAVVIGELFSGLEFLGYEAVKERVEEGQRILRALGYSPAGLIEADVTQAGFELAEADSYFLYDFGSNQAIQSILKELQRIALKRPFTVVARGRACRHAVESKHPWLAEVYPPRHFAHYSLYFAAAAAAGGGGGADGGGSSAKRFLTQSRTTSINVERRSI